MAEPSTVARPYAEAAFKLADAGNQLAKWSQMLAELALVAQDRGVGPGCEGSAQALPGAVQAPAPEPVVHRRPGRVLARQPGDVVRLELVGHAAIS